MLPPHLYGELAKTERGCELLRKHGDLENLLYIARNSGSRADDRKGALWAVVSYPMAFFLDDVERGIVFAVVPPRTIISLLLR